MRALYSGVKAKPDAAALAVFGLTPEDFPDLDDIVEVWPDNEPAVRLYCAMQSQWRVGFAGPTGLDYAALPAVLSLLGVPADAHPDTFDCLRVMEAEALAVMETKRG